MTRWELNSFLLLFIGLPRPGNVKEAVEGPDGILAGLDKDKVWIDHSTTDFEQTLVKSYILICHLWEILQYFYKNWKCL